jgi:PKD repeat protein
MRTTSRSSISPAIARIITATAIAVILVAANLTVINAQQQQQPPQQQQQQPQQLQSSSDRGGGLTATINSDSFTTGETIIISGSVAQRGSSSHVIIEITDPQGQLVKRGFPALTPTDNTFTYTFVAGELEQFDTNAPMVASGNYLVKVRYFPPSDGVVTDEVELSFGYNASNVPGAAAPTTAGTNTTAGEIESEAASITPTSSQSASTQNATSTTTGAASNFQSTNDSFSIDVPVGWRIQDLNNTGSVLSEESTRGYGMLAQLCREVEEQQRQGGAATAPSSGNNSINSCQTTQEEVIHVIRYPNLDNGILSANAVTNSVTTPTTGATFNTNNISNSTTATPATIDNILAYHLQKLQQVGYNNIQIVNNVDTSVNLTMAQSNQTLTTLPAKFVEMTYTTASSAPDETKRGYFLLTATNATVPNLGVTKGYSVFYEGNSISAETRSANSSSSPTPLPEAVRQVFGSFELVTAAATATATATQTEEPLTVEIIASDTEDTAPATFEFEANVTGGAAPYTISWDFDDGSVEENDDAEEGDENEEVEHTFDEAGSYSVSLSVTDSRGQSASDSIEITVEEAAVVVVEEEEGNDSVDVEGAVDDFIDDLFGRLGLR